MVYLRILFFRIPEKQKRLIIKLLSVQNNLSSENIHNRIFGKLTQFSMKKSR